MAMSAAQALALIRIGVGLYFLTQGFNKLASGWLSSGDTLVNQFLNPAVQNGRAEAFYQSFLGNVVIPHGTLFSQLTALGEFAVGISLTLGFLTRAGGIVGMWLNLNYMLMKGLANSGGSVDRLFFLVELMLVLAAAGLVWGVDGLIRQRWGNHPLARVIAGDQRREAVPPFARAA